MKTAAEAKDLAEQQPLYEKYVNPQWVRLLDVLGMNVRYTSCVGSELFTDDGRRILDSIPATAFITWDTTIPALCVLSKRSSISMDRRCCKGMCRS